MAIGKHFFVAIHALAIIAAFQGEMKITSEKIAESTGMNAVTIRNTFRSLKSANLIRVKPGPGGVTLAAPPDTITLLAIYNAVEAEPLSDIFHLSQTGAPSCPVGRNITSILSDYFHQAAALMCDRLNATTLSDITCDLRKVEPELIAPWDIEKALHTNGFER